MKLGLRRHGSTHDPDRGSDPLGFLQKYWRFDFDNEGGSGYVQTNDCADLDLLPDPLAVGSTIGLAFEDDSGCGALFGSTTSTLIKTQGGQTTLLADGGDTVVSSNLGDVIVNLLSAGHILEVRDKDGNPLLEIDENGYFKWYTGAVDFFTDGGMFQVDTNAGGANFVNGPFEVDSNGGDVLVKPQGGKFTVYDGSGNKAFEVQSDGSVHIKTGATITADL